MRCVWLALAVVVYCAEFPLLAEPMTRARFPGCCAEILVVHRGVPAMGRIVINPDGVIFVEQIPEEHARWAARTLAAVVRPEKKTSAKGDWNSRGTSVPLHCCRWQSVGGFRLPASVVVEADAAENGAGSLFVSRHRLLESREQYAAR